MSFAKWLKQRFEPELTFPESHVLSIAKRSVDAQMRVGELEGSLQMLTDICKAYGFVVPADHLGGNGLHFPLPASEMAIWIAEQLGDLAQLRKGKP